MNSATKEFRDDFEHAELTAIEQPTLCIYGTADPVGTAQIMKRLVS